MPITELSIKVWGMHTEMSLYLNSRLLIPFVFVSPELWFSFTAREKYKAHKSLNIRKQYTQSVLADSGRDHILWYEANILNTISDLVLKEVCPAF